MKTELEKMHDYIENLWSKVDPEYLTDEQIQELTNITNLYVKNYPELDNIVDSPLSSIFDLYATKASLKQKMDYIIFNNSESIIGLLENIDNGHITDVENEYLMNHIETKIPLNSGELLKIDIDLSHGEIHYREYGETWKTEEF